MSATPVITSPIAETERVRPASGARAQPVNIHWRGLEPYSSSFDAMRAFTETRTPDTTDEIWLVEHPPVFTLGLARDPAHLLHPASDIPLVKVDRGGQITYHGPGQVVAYLLLDLRRRKLMVRELVPRIEGGVIDTRAPVISAAPPPPQLGHAGAKIAALGLKIRNGCSYHGVSLNVKMDLQPFLAINPCGYAGLETVDMATLGVAADWNDVAQTLAENLTLHIGGHRATAAQPQNGVAV